MFSWRIKKPDGCSVVREHTATYAYPSATKSGVVQMFRATEIRRFSFMAKFCLA
jgi:hypothetical protein